MILLNSGDEWLTREVDFMQRWQQTFVDERGGDSGENFSELLCASQEVHQSANPSGREYYKVQTERAVLLGALAFETFCQDSLVQPIHNGATLAVEVEEAAADLPDQFKDLTGDYVVAYHTRYEEEVSPEPVTISTKGFPFYEKAQEALFDRYLSERIKSGDFVAGQTAESFRIGYEKQKDTKYAVAALFAENVSAILDVLVAMGASLCIEKRRVCSAEELSGYVIDNISVFTAVTSVTRTQRQEPRPGGSLPALPFGYGTKVLRSDAAMVGKLYIKAVNESQRYRAQWLHPSLEKGKWSRPGHCPASDYNPLQPRTAAELTAVQASLASAGLGYLAADGALTSAQLLISRSLPIAQETIYENDEWQSRILAAHAL